MKCCGRFVPLLIWVLFFFFSVLPGSARADATTARAEIEAVVNEIHSRANQTKGLAAAKQLSAAFTHLEALNLYIEGNLSPVFYDRVQEVRREDPAYVPPTIQIDLGPAFTPAFWDAKIQTADQSLENAVGALSGIPAMAALDYQDQAFAYLKTVKDTVSSVKDVAEDIATFDLVGLFFDTKSGLEDFIENYEQVEAADLANINRELFKTQVNGLVKKAKRNLERMKALKSAMVVNRTEALQFVLHLRNIARYTDSAVKDPVFPLDFNNADYSFDPAPHTAAVDRLSASFAAAELCWAEFVNIYQGIYREALAEKSQVEANINSSAEPPENKNVYLNDVASNWGYFDDHAQGVYDAHDGARAAAQAEHDALLASADLLRSQRQALIDSYWDSTGFVTETLRTFDEAAEGIVQTNLPDFSGTSPYYLTREYDPLFPLSPLASSYEMPSIAPDIADYTHGTYPEALIRLAGAYRVMAEAGLETDSDRVYAGSGNPVAQFAKSPLSLARLDDVAANLQTLQIQVDRYEAFMADRRALIADIEAKQAELAAAEDTLFAHAAANWIYLCQSEDEMRADADLFWDVQRIAVLLADWDSDTGAFFARAVIDAHLDYIEGLKAFNAAVAESGALLQRLSAQANLRNLLNFIIGDYTVLPAMPSEQGYLDFLTELNYLHAFYGPADRHRVMDLRQELKDLFTQVYADPSSLNAWMTRQNPYTVLPENEAAFQQLIDAVGLWSDLYMESVRDGFPGWEVWARSELAENWPNNNIDEDSPAVVYRSPGPGSGAVSVYQTLQVGFSEKMDAATLAPSHVVLTANGVARTVALRYDAAGRTLYVHPGRMLPGTVYQLSLTDGCTDLAGNPLAAESWLFTTEVLEQAAAADSVSIGGVQDGGSYADPVTLDISSGSGSHLATLRFNSEPAEPVASGMVLSRRGRYELTVATGTGLVRTVEFTVGTVPEGFEVNAANFYTTPLRPRAMTDKNSVAAGLAYFVDGERYYYNLGGKVYRFDLLTGNDTLLFDAGYYYQTEGGVNVAPSTYCSFLAVAGDRLLYVKNTGAEGPGLSPDEKIFALFVFDQETGRSSKVPTADGVSIADGLLFSDTVAWIEDSGAYPVLRTWQVGTAAASVLLEFSTLEAFQLPALMGMDRSWVLYKIGDGGNYTFTDLNPDVFGYERRVPKGESLHAVSRRTGEVQTLAARDPENPVRIGDAALAGGRAAYLEYASSGEVVGGYWVDTCHWSRLVLGFPGAETKMIVSAKPQVTGFETSETLIYYTDRVSAPPYDMSAAPNRADLVFTVFDTFNYQTYVADLGTTGYSDYHLFGDRMVSDHDAARVIPFSTPSSTTAVADRTPAPDAAGVSADAVITVTFSGPVDPDSLTREWIALSRVDAGGAFLEGVAAAVSYDPASDVLTLDPGGLVSGGRYRVALSGGIRDESGNTLTVPSLWHFTVADTSGPVFLNSSPAPDSIIMAPGANITLRFDEAADSATAATGVVLQAGGVPVAFSATDGVDGDLILTPDSPLAAGTSYTLELNTGLTDAAGNPLVNPQTFSFTTVTRAATAVAGTILYPEMMAGGVFEIGLPGLLSQQVSADFVQDLVSSPDGSYVYYLSGGLVVLDRFTGTVTPLATAVPYRFTPDFSPDGTRILYARDKEGVTGHELVSSSLAGTDWQVLVDFDSGSVSTAKWSPDGSRIAYAWAEGFGTPQLRVLTLATGQTLTLADAHSPAWSPDGQTLFAMAKTASTGFRQALVALSPDLSTVRVIRESDGADAVAVSPTGRFMAAFEADGIYLVDLFSGYREQKLVCAPASMSTVRMFWTEDESALVFSAIGIDGSWDPGIYTFDLAGATVSTVYTVQGGMPGMPFAFVENPGAAGPGPVEVAVSDLSTAGAPALFLDWGGYADAGSVSLYRVYRAQARFTSAAGMTPLAETAGFQYTDTGAVFGADYYYAVTPVTAVGKDHMLVSPAGPVSASDSDDLDDEWEIRHFGSLAALADADPDNDGLTNREEEREFTDPTRGDTDGDGAPDGAELARGLDPLTADAAPVTLSAPASELLVSGTLDLVTRGGSGLYTWQVSGEGAAQADENGTLTGLSAGPISVVAQDLAFPGFASDPVVLTVLAEPFGIRPQTPLVLQIGGHVILEALGGSGFHEWRAEPEGMAALSATGARCRLSALAENGSFEVTVTDLLVTERGTDTVAVTIGAVAGDASGDSQVDLQDAVLTLQVQTALAAPAQINRNGDATGDGKIGMGDALFILRSLQETPGF